MITKGWLKSRKRKNEQADGNAVANMSHETRTPNTILGLDILDLSKIEADSLDQLRIKQTLNNLLSKMRKTQVIRDPMPYGSVLIVDDMEMNLHVASGLLRPYGIRTDTAGSGFEAVEKIKDGSEYDIVFMDHLMPKMDGMAAAKIIRGMGYNRPIVALTSNTAAGQADVFLANGFDAFISKPIDTRQLNDLLNKLIRDKQPANEGLVRVR
jgi:CheY-like chemotaxis protein